MNKQPASYLQTDPRWGSLDYSAKGEKTTIGRSGCGPTAMAMVLVAGLYYIQDGVTYLCTRSTGQPVYHAMSELVGLYVEMV